jgi:arsenite-transporting ATPase
VHGLTTRHLFFTGKGGVGKTTLAASVAVALADGGERTLLVSTDPASNLDDLFGIAVGTSPTVVPGVARLWVMNIDPEGAARSHRERVVAPFRGVLPDSAVRSMEEQLSGACTVEIAAFNEFTALLVDPALGERFDRIVFDTAPTGHTLRLLSLPSAWTGFLDTSTTGASCLGPLAGLEQQREAYRDTVAALADGERTTVVLVSRPDDGALREAARASVELAALGVRHQRLMVNGVLSSDVPDADGGDAGAGDAVADAVVARQRGALAAMPVALRVLPRDEVPLVTTDLVGVDALRALGRWMGGGTSGEATAGTVERVDAAEAPSMPMPEASPTGTATAPDASGAVSSAPAVDAALRYADLDDLVAHLAADGAGVVMTMGKGGVGKTTVAADVALALARLGHRVHLSTTDPAAHVAAAVDAATDGRGAARPATLTVSRIDPVAETARYADEVLAAAGPLDDDERALLEEDLRSPCTEEIAVFRAFARTVAEAADGFVVLDTAPTGHTLLLLDATQSYHREVGRSTGQVPDEVRALLPRLTDPAYTRVLLVTLAESTPVEEAARLQADLRRAGIEPYGWVVNASLAASGTRHPVLAARAALERTHLARVAQELSARRWLVPWRGATVRS